jgi:predicted esterase
MGRMTKKLTASDIIGVLLHGTGAKKETLMEMFGTTVADVLPPLVHDGSISYSPENDHYRLIALGHQRPAKD